MPTDQPPPEKSLSQLIADALMEVSPETSQAITDHPDAPELAKRVQQVLGLGQTADLMSPQERVAYKKSTGEDINAVEQPATSLTEEDSANVKRLQAISDIALEAQRVAATKRDPSAPAPKQQEGMIEGLTNLLKKSLDESLSETKSDIKLLKEIISTDIQKRMK